MDGKGGERKAVLRGHSWPSQPALEHPGGSESGAFVVAPGGDAHRHGPPRCLLPLRRCYFWLSISAALQRVIFLPRSQDPARQRLSRWVVGRTPLPAVPPGSPGTALPRLSSCLRRVGAGGRPRPRSCWTTPLCSSAGCGLAWGMSGGQMLLRGFFFLFLFALKGKSLPWKLEGKS